VAALGAHLLHAPSIDVTIAQDLDDTIMVHREVLASHTGYSDQSSTLNGLGLGHRFEHLHLHAQDLHTNFFRRS
jgi:hypothetical protein